MATTIAERDSRSSQMYFDWMHSEPRKTSKLQRKWRDSPKPRRFSSSIPAVAEPKIRQTVSVSRKERTGEVRLGAVMLQLLKRYGITDEEIAQALAPDCSQVQ